MTTALAAISSGRAWLERSLGETRDQMRTAQRVAVGSAAVLVVGTTALIADHAVALWRAPGETARVEELEGRTKGDATIASPLHDERKRQTDVSLARKTRSRVLAWILLVAGGLFVAAEKWQASLRPRALPSLDELVAVRFAAPEQGGMQEQRAGPAGKGSEGKGNVAPEAVDLEFVDGLIDRFGRGREAAIPILQAIQSHYR